MRILRIIIAAAILWHQVPQRWQLHECSLGMLPSNQRDEEDSR